MIILLDTSTPVCRLTLVDGEQRFETEWQADRTLAKGLLKYLQDQLVAHGSSWDELTGIVVLKGPGSFTGLRIGISVLNTVAYAQHIPIVGETGPEWRETGLQRLAASEDDHNVVPEYGAEANITQPRK